MVQVAVMALLGQMARTTWGRGSFRRVKTFRADTVRVAMAVVLVMHHEDGLLLFHFLI